AAHALCACERGLRGGARPRPLGGDRGRPGGGCLGGPGRGAAGWVSGARATSTRGPGARPIRAGRREPAAIATHRSRRAASRYRNVGSATGTDQRLRRRTRVAYVVTDRSAGSPAASVTSVITTV